MKILFSQQNPSETNQAIPATFANFGNQLNFFKLHQQQQPTSRSSERPPTRPRVLIEDHTDSPTDLSTTVSAEIREERYQVKTEATMPTSTVVAVRHQSPPLEASKISSSTATAKSSVPPLPHKKIIMGKIEHGNAAGVSESMQHAQTMLQLSQEPLLLHQRTRPDSSASQPEQRKVEKAPPVEYYMEIGQSSPAPLDVRPKLGENNYESRHYLTNNLNEASLASGTPSAQQLNPALIHSRIFPKDEPMSPRSLASSPLASGTASPRSPINSALVANELSQRLASKGLLQQQIQPQHFQHLSQQQVVISPAETLVISTSTLDSDNFIVSSANSPTSTVPVTTESPDIPQTKIPGTTVYEGEYGFRISFAPQMKETKSAQWTYSPMLHKLFTRINAACPIRFQCAYKLPPSGTLLRALPIYMQPEHVCESVVRCPVHAAMPLDNDANPLQGGRPTNHLIRADHPHADYSESDPHYGRQSVCVPFEAPAVGTIWSTVLYRFMCNSSCAGGMNRRPIQTVFTLETPTGEVIGRQVVEVRICACPGRDSKVEERNLLNKGNGGDISSKAHNTKMEPGFILDGPLPMNSATLVHDVFPTSGRKRKRAPHHEVSQHHDDEEAGPVYNHGAEDQRVFTLLVRGRDTYELLKRLRDSIELSKMATSDQLDKLQTMEAEMEQQVNAASSLISFMSQPPENHHNHPTAREGN